MYNELLAGVIGGIVSGVLISFVNATNQKSINMHSKFYEIAIEANEIFDLIVRSQMEKKPELYILFKERIENFKSKYLSLLSEKEQSHLSLASAYSNDIQSIEKFIEENDFPDLFTKAGLSAYNLKELLSQRVRGETSPFPRFIKYIPHAIAFKNQGGFWIFLRRIGCLLIHTFKWFIFYFRKPE